MNNNNVNNQLAQLEQELENEATNAKIKYFNFSNNIQNKNNAKIFLNKNHPEVFFQLCLVLANQIYENNVDNDTINEFLEIVENVKAIRNVKNSDDIEKEFISYIKELHEQYKNEDEGVKYIFRGLLLFAKTLFNKNKINKNQLNKQSNLIYLYTNLQNNNNINLEAEFGIKPKQNINNEELAQLKKELGIEN